MERKKVVDILDQIGFTRTQDLSNFVEFLPIYQFDFGNFVLDVKQIMNLHFRIVLVFSGNNFTARTAQMVWFELPLEVDSCEQGLAFISRGLGSKFIASKIPDWYYEGLKLKDHLPWRKEMKEFDNRPVAYIDNDYIRLLIKKLRDILSSADGNDITTFSFDGSTLVIVCSGKRLLAPSSGNPWKETVAIRNSALSNLPKKIYSRFDSISLWQGNLLFGGKQFPVIGHENA